MNFQNDLSKPIRYRPKTSIFEPKIIQNTTNNTFKKKPNPETRSTHANKADFQNEKPIDHDAQHRPIIKPSRRLRNNLARFESPILSR